MQKVFEFEGSVAGTVSGIPTVRSEYQTVRGVGQDFLRCVAPVGAIISDRGEEWRVVSNEFQRGNEFRFSWHRLVLEKT